MELIVIWINMKKLQISRSNSICGLLLFLEKGVYVLFLRDTFVTDEQMYTILYSKYVYAIYADKGPIGKVQNRLYNVIGNTF
ncbi:hypothetical protein bcgnr5394_11130 [Bacillus cereus]|nr:hypothetical protein BCJMU10_4201 [Bacillus cereus]BCT38434.1 hypothetical protein WHT_c42790 [Bacillus cereus]GMB77977.1 hypothetical protein BCER1_43780 [Bacillus cereus]